MCTNKIAYGHATSPASAQCLLVDGDTRLLKKLFVLADVSVKRAVHVPITAGVEGMLVEVAYKQHFNLGFRQCHQQIEVMAC
ncbi:hypothetical protein D3C75_1274890 [compost metagenome]